MFERIVSKLQEIGHTLVRALSHFFVESLVNHETAYYETLLEEEAIEDYLLYLPMNAP